MKRALGFIAFSCLVLSSATAQRPTAPGTTPTPSPGNNPNTIPGSNGNVGSQSGTATQDPESSMPIFLAGKVAVADGSPLPDSVTIQQICPSGTRSIAYTDRKGHFSFQWGQTAWMLPDASESSTGVIPGSAGNPSVRGNPSRLNGNMAAAPEMGTCELNVDVPGYRADPIILAGHRAFDNPDLGTIVLHRLGNVEGLSVSSTSFKAPADARKAYDRGLQSLHKGKPAEAEKDFEKAVALYPQYANAWLDLGKVRLQNKATDAAREAFMKALEADAKLVQAHIELGILAASQSQWEDAAKYLDAGLRLDPVDFPRAWFVDAVANFNVKNFDASEKSVREALKIDTKHQNPQADRLLGMILAVKRDFTGAVAELRTYLKLAPDSPDAAQVKSQLVEIENLRAPTQP